METHSKRCDPRSDAFVDEIAIELVERKGEESAWIEEGRGGEVVELTLIPSSLTGSSFPPRGITLDHEIENR